MRMRIAVLTLSLHTNYGGIVQAYALVTVLQKMGHEAWLIDSHFHKASYLRQKWRRIKELKDRITGKQTIAYPPKRLKSAAFQQYMKPFIDKNLPRITKTFVSLDTAGEKIQAYGFDAYVVGSDQIWNPRFFPKIEAAFFSFLGEKNKIRLSYAPSFGTDTWSYTDEQTLRCKALIRLFDGVSVREDQGISFCKEHFDVEACWVLDPAMLLSAKDYEALLPGEVSEEKGDLFTYILDHNEDKQLLVDAVAKSYGYIPFNLDTIEGYENCPLEWRTKETVEQWIRNFKDAKFIITDSFHGCVFSIIFNKPFYVLINYDRGAVRFKSLLNLFNLQDRVLSSKSELSEKAIKNEINWTSVNAILNQKRVESFSYLERSLGSTAMV